MRYLPSRKFTIVVAATTLVAGAFWTFFGPQPETVSNESTKKAAGAVVAGGTETKWQDSDNDGLADWEEKLLGTDPDNHDTDDDGVPDGEQYRSEKRYAKLEYEDPGSPFAARSGRLLAIPSGNLTDSLVREAALRYGSLAASAEGELGEEVKAALADSLARDFETENRGRFTGADIALSEDTSQIMANAYLANVLLAFMRYPLAQDADPVAEIGAWSSSEDTAALRRVRAIGAEYEALAEELVGITTPKRFAAAHLALANTNDEMARAVREMATAAADPVKSILAGARFLSLRAERQDMVVALTQYMHALAAR